MRFCLCLFLFPGVSCVPIDSTNGNVDGEASAVQARVVIVNVVGLEPPAVPAQGVFKPQQMFDIDGNPVTSDEACGFHLTVAAPSEASVRIRIVDVNTNESHDLVQVDGPTTPEERGLAARSRVFNDAVGALVQSGKGVYWLADAVEGGAGLFHRIAVVVPTSLLTTFVRLGVSAAEVNGIPIGSDEIELVPDFFYVAVIGDSVLWGNGLRESDKMTALVADQLERVLHKKVITQRFAQSGARIVPVDEAPIGEPNAFGEVPRVHTPILEQVDFIRRGELMDLVLVDGCLNDVGLDTIIDPFTDRTVLMERTREFCGPEMVKLLRRVKSVAPEAHIVVTGYYPIVSLESDPLGLKQWATIQGFGPLQFVDGFVEAQTAQSDLFVETAHASLAEAVGTINDESDTAAPITLAIPDFGPENAVFTPNRWLWSMTSDNDFFRGLNLGLDLFPEDPISPTRLEACAQRGLTIDLLTCIYASVGHPNVAGAQAYAQVILTHLRQQGVVPPE